MSVKVVDKGAKKLLTNLSKSLPIVRVGIIGSKAAEDHGGTTTAQVAAYHELGAGVPRRSWLLDGITESTTKLRPVMETALRSVCEGDDAFLEKFSAFGQYAAGLLQERIAAGIDPPLSARTTASKGSSVPLIDTGQLRTAISSDVKIRKSRKKR